MSDDKLVRMPKAVCQASLQIADKELNCAVLDNGTRVINMTAVFKAFGRSVRSKINVGNRVINMPSFIDAQNLQPFVSDELKEVVELIKYKSMSRGEVKGYDARIIPLVCDAYLAARQAGVLTKKQMPVAMASEILVRSLSKVGIIALVDEATGYQELRERDELQKLLALYISEELVPWAKMFPNEFYEQMFRLRGWKYSSLHSRRPPLVGKLTNQIVYERLPPGVLEELRTKNPVINGRRKHKHFQFLTEDIGHPHLRAHLVGVTALMRAAPNWNAFKRMVERAYPKQGDQLHLSLNEEG